LTTIAPTGTISLLAGNVSSGIEPVFDFRYHRRVRTAEGLDHQEIVEDFAYAQYQRLNEGDRPSGPEWINAAGLTPLDHLAMQAALQPHVDSAISKTINCPADIDPKAFEDLYMTAYDLGLKGCTLFRPNAVTGAVLSAIPASIVPETGAAGPENEAKAPDASEVCPRCLQSKQRTRQRLGQCETCLECGTSSCE
jgi:ribonucleoside-diphosphate reductase alpha chain